MDLKHQTIMSSIWVLDGRHPSIIILSKGTQVTPIVTRDYDLMARVGTTNGGDDFLNSSDPRIAIQVVWLVHQT